jgi:predicted deacetylase
MTIARYVIRLDDISWNMDLLKFNRMREILLKYDIKPLMGVIPKNEDCKLKKLDNNLGIEEFWKLIKRLHSEYGWQIALHGYEHRYITSSSGILKINNRSEFARVAEEEQYKKISLGKKILLSYGLKIAAFMAPAHSFDRSTLRSLMNNEINVVTDGYGLYPYRKGNIVFVPQIFSRPRKMPFGIYTFCFHTNEMKDSDFDRIDNFIGQNLKNFISFNEAAAIENKKLWVKLLNALIFLFMYTFRASKLFIKNWRG